VLQGAIFLILLLMSIVFTCFVPQIIQTGISFIIQLGMITDFVFVFSDYEITHQNLEVQGIERVRVLCDCASENGNGMESIYIPSFPSQLPSFDMHYNLCADISFALWHEVICSVRVLLTQGLCRMAQSQGVEFYSKCLTLMKMEKWNWLKENMIGGTAAIAIHRFTNPKHVLVHSGGGCTIHR